MLSYIWTDQECFCVVFKLKISAYWREKTDIDEFCMHIVGLLLEFGNETIGTINLFYF